MTEQPASAAHGGSCYGLKVHSSPRLFIKTNHVLMFKKVKCLIILE